MIRPFKKQRQLSLTPNYIILILLVGFALGPLLVLSFNSLKGSAEAGRNPLGFPATIIWENYPNAWERGGFATTTRNSTIFVLGTVVGVLLLGGMAAYSLARLKMPGANLVMGYFLIASTLPVVPSRTTFSMTTTSLGCVTAKYGSAVRIMPNACSSVVT